MKKQLKNSIQNWRKFIPSILLVFSSLVLMGCIFVNYRSFYYTQIEDSKKIIDLNELLIQSQYVEVDRFVEEGGEGKIIKTQVRKAPKRDKPQEREVKGVYLTAYGATVPSLYNRANELIDDTEINAVVIDIKDYSGKLSYESEVALVKQIKADTNPKINDMKKIIDELHKKDVYVIARQTIFQDPVLSKEKPEWAVINKYNGKRWVDRKGLGWADPSVKEVWDYNIEIAKEAVKLGFDEINLDYIRFPTDGNMSAMKFHNHSDDKPKHETIKEFIKYFSEAMKNEPAYISVDLFGLVTVKVDEEDDLGIGQLLVDFIPYVDYICPMVYPSHYASGFNGYENPALYPYEIVNHSMKKAIETAFNNIEEKNIRAKLRPWLQDFDMGAVYDASMVRKQINASENAGAYGWLLWDPRNWYTKGALKK